MIKVASIIINWNNYDLTRACTASFKKIVSLEHEVVLIDNNSINGSTQKIQKEFSQFTYIYNSQNVGIAAANNIGMKYAFERGADYVLLCNNDIEILQEDTMKRLLSYAEKNPEVGILGVRLVYPDGRQQLSVKPLPTLWNQFYFEWFAFKKMLNYFGFRPVPFDYNRIQDVEYLMGAVILVRRKMIEQIGLQDERFFCGYEDVDLCRRALDAGWKVRYFPEVTIMHVHGVTAGKLLKNFDYYFSERLRYFKKHHFLLTVMLFRFLVSIGALIRALWGWARWLIKRADQYEDYAKAYSRLFYRIWLFPWRKNTPPAPPPQGKSI